MSANSGRHVFPISGSDGIATRLGNVCMAIEDSAYPTLSLAHKITSLLAIYYGSHTRGVQVAANGPLTNLMLASFPGIDDANDRVWHASKHA